MENRHWQLMLFGDNKIFLEVYRRHYPALYRYGFSLCADREMVKDCIQEIFLEIWNKRNTINKDVLDIRSYLFTWLRRSIMHKLSGIFRERLVNPEQNIVELPYEDLLIAFQQTEEEKEKLRRALEKLTRKQLEVIRLRFFNELSYTDIAAKTSLSTRTVYNLIYQAIQSLRKNMEMFFFFG